MAEPTPAGDGNGNPLATPSIKAIKEDKTGHFANLIRQIFHCATEWPQPSKKPGRWKMLQPQQEIDESLMVGDFLHVPENATYRILGMKTRRQGGVNGAIEYDVARLPKDIVQMRGFVAEPVVRDYSDYVMRMCTSEDVEVQKRFMHTYEVFSKVHRTFPSSEVRSHFPAIFGAGAFEKLFYKQLAEDFTPRYHCVHFLSRPRPYFIRERIGLTFDELLNNSYYGFIDIPTARYLTVGVIRALKAIHGLELVHRCVSSSCFALRSHPGGFIPDGELSNQVVCTDASFAFIFRSSTRKPKPYVRHFVGTYKYSSPNAMKCRPQYPSDDIVSAIYLFVELIHGRLAWRGIIDREAIIASKEVFHVNPTILVDNLDPEYRIPIDIRDLSLIFKMLKDDNPFKGRLNYTYVCEILHRIAEANKQPDWITYLELARKKDVENLFAKALRIHRPPPESGSHGKNKKKSKSKSKTKKRKHRKHKKSGNNAKNTATQSRESATKDSKETATKDQSSTNLNSTQIETVRDENNPTVQKPETTVGGKKTTNEVPLTPSTNTMTKEKQKDVKKVVVSAVPPSKKSEKPVTTKNVKDSKKAIASKKETLVKKEPSKVSKLEKPKEKEKSQKPHVLPLGASKENSKNLKKSSKEKKEKSIMAPTQMDGPTSTDVKRSEKDTQKDTTVLKSKVDEKKVCSQKGSCEDTQDDEEEH